METPLGSKRKGLVCLYEFLGQIFFMYAVQVSGGLKSDFAGIVGPLALFAVASLFGGISGGHFNPAVTTGVYIREKKYAKHFVFYLMIMAAQISGAIVGMLLGYIVLRTPYEGKWIVPQCSVPLLVPDFFKKHLVDHNARIEEIEGFQYGGEFSTFYMEVVCTFIFVLFILFVSGKHGGGSVWGLPAICFVLWALCTVDAFTGASFNPALTTGQTLFQGWWFESAEMYAMYHYFIYYFGGAMTGGALAGIFYNIYEKYVLDVIAAEKAAEAEIIKPQLLETSINDFNLSYDLKKASML